MTGEELGTILGDVVSVLENVSMDTEEIVSELLDINGRTILLDGADGDGESNQPCMTIDELGELLGNAVSELETIVMEIENAMDQLQSIDGKTLTAN